jgi:hypothetical protein
MAKKKLPTPEEHQKSLMESAIRDIEYRKKHGMLSLNPTRIFKVGERVIYGAHREVYVREVFEEGLYYHVECMNVQREKNQPPRNEQHIMEWYRIFPITNKGTTFRKEENYRIRMLNAGIGSLLHLIYHGGVDFDVDYQREHVWTLDDKVALIDSIFNNIDIGKFVFVQRSFHAEGCFYEIVDGKQRLTTLREFYEDRFKYNGFYYSELSPMDKNKFEDHPIAYGYLENPDKRAIFETFIKLNTCGKPMDVKHIQKVKDLLNELDK